MNLLIAAVLVLTVPQVDLKDALLFHAGFDGKADADFGAGDRTLYHGLGTPLRDTKPGLAPTVELAKGAGKYGDALKFPKKIKPIVFFKGAKHVAWKKDDFRGTVSFWMKLDPEEDLEPGYCDPIQVTDKKWNDSCFFVDFDKAGDPRLFRLGAYSDMAFWNPKNLKFREIPPEKLPLVTVKRHPFTRDSWTHVCFTWEGINTGREDSTAKLYLDGKLQGELRGKKVYTWDVSKSAIVLGMNYVGLIDDVSVFGRPLSGEEVAALRSLKGGVRMLHAGE